MSDPHVDAFFGFMLEREQVRLRKEADLSYPWTDDEILSSYKFTNVYRHHDRTSRILREKFYGRTFDETFEDINILMNCAMYRYFGTWEFAEAIGWLDFREKPFERIKSLAKQRMRDKERVFTGAYVITNQGIRAPKEDVVVDHFLRSLWDVASQIVFVAQALIRWEDTSKVMRQVSGFGGTGFMTKEILLDTTYTSFWPEQYETEHGLFSLPEDWYFWTLVGPGARRGAARVRGDDSAKPLTETRAFSLIRELVGEQKSYWPSDWPTLCPHDIQFQLCEFDKYERVRLGQGKPRSKYRPRDK